MGSTVREGRLCVRQRERQEYSSVLSNSAHQSGLWTAFKANRLAPKRQFAHYQWQQANSKQGRGVTEREREWKRWGGMEKKCNRAEQSRDTRSVKRTFRFCCCCCCCRFTWCVNLLAPIGSRRRLRRRSVNCFAACKRHKFVCQRSD